MININKLIIRNLLIIMVITIFICQTVAYSALSTTMNISGKGFAKIQTDVRITDLKVKELSSDAIVSYEEFSRKAISTNIKLPTTSSYITYEIEVTNYGSKEAAILNITGIPSTLTYEISNYTLKDNICDTSNKCTLGAKKVIYLTLRPKSASTNNYELLFYLNFSSYNTITYQNIDSTNLPTQVLNGDSIEIDFGENAPNGVVVTMGQTQLDYNYENGILKVNNVSGDIIITDMSNYDLSGNENTIIYANTTITDEGLTFDGTSSSARLPDDTGVTFPATYSLKFMTNATYNQIIFGDRTTNAGFGTYTNNTKFIATIGGSAQDAPVFNFNTKVGVLYQIDILYESINKIRLFVDGVEVTSRGTNNRWDWSNNESYLGRRGYSATLGHTYFDGVIEKFMIYDDLLTEEEILYNMNSTNPNDVIKDNLKLYYYFK